MNVVERWKRNYERRMNANPEMQRTIKELPHHLTRKHTKETQKKKLLQPGNIPLQRNRYYLKLKTRKEIPQQVEKYEKGIPNETLNGGYPGLYGEVVTEDIYKLKELNFIPDVILDLGANIGIFSRYARQLFPNALIISVEPHPDNIKVFKKYTKDRNTKLIGKGIGEGKLYQSKKAANGSAEVYLSENSAFKESTLKSICNISTVKSIMLTDLKKYIKKEDKVLCKIDIEGNETKIFNDKDSMDLLLSFEYVTIELHYFGMTPNGVRNIKKYTKNKLVSLNKTHDIKYIHPLFYATKYT